MSEANWKKCEWVQYHCNPKDGNLVIPHGIKGLTRGSIVDGYNLLTVDFPDTLEVIGGSCFMYCPMLEHIQLPQSIRELTRIVFYKCTKLKYVVIPDGMHKIGYSSFSGCDNLSMVIILTIAPIDLFTTFRNCPKLKTVVLLCNHKCRIPDTLTPIYIRSVYITRRDAWVLTERQKTKAVILVLACRRFGCPDHLVWGILENIKINQL